MTLDDLARIATALCGTDRWQSEIASLIGVSDRTMRRWIAKKATLPDDLPDRLEHAIEQRMAELEDTRRSLRSLKETSPA